MPAPVLLRRATSDETVVSARTHGAVRIADRASQARWILQHVHVVRCAIADSARKDKSAAASLWAAGVLADVQYQAIGGQAGDATAQFILVGDATDAGQAHAIGRCLANAIDDRANGTRRLLLDGDVIAVIGIEQGCKSESGGTR